MKLRNKRTGEIINAGDMFNLASYAENGMSIREEYEYKTLSELCEDWEDYKPAEPLIKDEKVRKAVRAWAEASGIEKVLSYGGMYWIGFRSTNTASVWKFECNYLDGSNFKLDKEYTIAELCGEEEE